MYSAVAQVRTTAAIQYSSFMNMYEFVTTIEFILLMFIVLSRDSGQYQRGEGEADPGADAYHPDDGFPGGVRQTDERPQHTASADCVQLSVRCHGICLWRDYLDRCSIAASLLYNGGVFAGSLGICFSALFKRSTISTVVTYGVLVAVVAGTYFINKFTLSLSAMNINNTAAAYGFGENAVKPTSGGFFYLLLLNPASTFLAILNGQAGGNTPLSKLKSSFGMTATNFVTENWVIVSIPIQLALAALRSISRSDAWSL